MTRLQWSFNWVKEIVRYRKSHRTAWMTWCECVIWWSTHFHWYHRCIPEVGRNRIRQKMFPNNFLMWWKYNIANNLQAGYTIMRASISMVFRYNNIALEAMYSIIITPFVMKRNWQKYGEERIIYQWSAGRPHKLQHSLIGVWQAQARTRAPRQTAARLATLARVEDRREEGKRASGHHTAHRCLFMYWYSWNCRPQLQVNLHLQQLIFHLPRKQSCHRNLE